MHCLPLVQHPLIRATTLTHVETQARARGSGSGSSGYEGLFCSHCVRGTSSEVGPQE